MATNIIKHQTVWDYPTMQAKSTRGEITITPQMTDVVDIPLTYVDVSINSGNILTLDSGHINQTYYDNWPAEVTASAYMKVDNNNTQVDLFIYHYRSPSSTDQPGEVEVAAGQVTLTTTNGVVQITPRIITAVCAGDYFCLKARIKNGSGAIVCNHKDTQLQVKLLPNS